ncbi:unnamed protein product [Prorocentrum cordatum]|uniref:Mediator of RNA polymerase II transcription subunit 21 n=1 Tax=Prorocentrum cordatum TaxID=2364126 RepID=A0ABN9RT80_9DINO|nr:unnamed protein product [Polarella glacialis]
MMFEQASEEMRVLTSVALDQLSEQLALGKMAHDMSPPRNAFVEEAVQAPAETVDVKVAAPASPFPAVADLVEDMEKDLDDKEAQARAKILGMLGELIEAEADMVRLAFSAAPGDAP